MFLSLVRGLAKDSSNIAWSKHVRERFAQRDINNRMAVTVLRNGQIRGDIVPGNNAGEWKAKLFYPIPGRREVGVAMILIREKKILVKTVEWED